MIVYFSSLFSELHHFLMSVPYLGDIRPVLLYSIVFATTVLESVPVIGTFAPGTLLLLLFGFVSTHQSISLVAVISFAVLGGVLGDIIGYYIGKRGLRYLYKFKWALKYAKIEKGSAFFQKHGGKSILLARFIGPIRPIVPMFAGAFEMPLKKFLLWNISGSILWATIYICLGYMFGANIKLFALWASRAGIFGFIIIVVLLVLYGWKEKKTQQVLDSLKVDEKATVTCEELAGEIEMEKKLVELALESENKPL